MSENRQGEQEDFLTRWSRRKTLSRQGEELPEPADDTGGEQQDASPAAQEPAVVPEDLSPEPAAEEAGVPEEAAPELPPLESLDQDSDYSAFLGDGVPADLKQKALRKLFHSPKFNIRDGLDDYDWDFSNPEPLGDIITAEMRYRVQRELERLAGLDDDEEREEDTTTVAAVDVEEHDEADNEVDPEADDDRPEPA
jgi:hypothetical protein